jgi:peptide/nickel transport system permease protein
VKLTAVLFVVSAGTFLLVHLLPGDPVAVLLGPANTPQAHAKLAAFLGLDKPIVQQYVIWLGHAITGNLGISYISRQAVSSTIAKAYPIDLELVVISQLMALVIALPLAMVAARRAGRWADHAANGLAMGFLSIPPFVVAVLTVLFLAVDIKVFPAVGYVSISQDWAQNLRDMVLPSFALGVGSVAVYFRMLRSDLVSTLKEDFITLARAKGLSTRRIMWRHALRPSSLPLITVAGINIGTLIGGAFIVEYIFDLPGLGYHAVTSIYQRDYLLLQAIVLLVVTFFVVVNFAVDVIYTVVDPRARRG